MPKRSKLCLLGIPDHQGVIHVGGRIGAAQGPAAFRAAFARLKGAARAQWDFEDRGDVPGLAGDVVANHAAAARAVARCSSAGMTSVIVGGGHDHGYSHLWGLRQALGAKARLGCINLDAHLDVRKPTGPPTSGSPFYLAIEAKLIDPARLIEFGIQSHANSAELWDYVARKKVPVVPYAKLRGGRAVRAFSEQLRKLASRCDAVAVSLDMDAMAECHAPGVSAPQAEGFSASEMIEMLEIAGRNPKVRSLGIFELNPAHDIDSRTARLAATGAYHFLEARK